MLKDYLAVLQLLKRFGIYIYTGNKLDDIALIEDEVKEMFHHGILMKEDYLQALLILKQEKRKLNHP